MNPRLRIALLTVAAALLAVVLAWRVAEESYGWPLLAMAIAGGVALVWATGVSFDVILLGSVVFGYIVGNRGFAQLTPTPGLPLLPAEITLLVAGSWWIIASAFERRLPWELDALNWCVAILFAAGSVRLFFDVRAHGLMAARDYAMVYYACFFFMAQRAAGEPGQPRRFLIGCTVLGVLVLLPMTQLYEMFPGFFLRWLRIHGTPLIYYKGDLMFTFLAAGSLLAYHVPTGRNRYWAWPVAAVMFLLVAAGDSRASLLGLGVAMVWLVAARRWSYPLLQTQVAAVALVVMVTLAVGFDNNWARGKVAGLTDRVQSLTDIAGLKQYASESSSNKGDNNRFRLVWWRNVVEETWQGNPVFGLGFGHDLAHNFVQEYNPEMSEEFTARSPHNIFLSYFGRMGAVGLALWTALCGLVARETWRALRQSPDQGEWALWCGVWVLLVSGSLGVVLEGPMGAVPFWTMLGLAHAMARSRQAGAGVPAAA